MLDRYLVRESDDRVEDRSQVRVEGDPGYTGPWSPPASPNWDNVPGTYRHEDKALSDSCVGTIRDEYGAHNWTLPAGVWTAIDQATKDAEGLPTHKILRSEEMVHLQARMDAADIINAGSLPAAIKTAAMDRKAEYQERIDDHETEWENPWIEGSNP